MNNRWGPAALVKCLALHSGKDAGDEAALNKGNTSGCFPVKPVVPLIDLERD
jgi:hypothetical protein